MRYTEMGGGLTLHAPGISISIFSVIHPLKNCNAVYKRKRRNHTRRYAPSSVTTTMSTHVPNGSLGPSGKSFTRGSHCLIAFPRSSLALIHLYASSLESSSISSVESSKACNLRQGGSCTIDRQLAFQMVARFKSSECSGYSLINRSRRSFL